MFSGLVYCCVACGLELCLFGGVMCLGLVIGFVNSVGLFKFF